LKKVLVMSDAVGEADLRRLSGVARVYRSWRMNQKSIDDVLPDVDALVVFFWPSQITAEALSKMGRLRFVQSLLVGVNHVPFQMLDSRVLVASNAGAYSLEVGEHAWALVLAAAKNVVSQDIRILRGAKSVKEFAGEASKNIVLEGKTFGILGYGGIGRSTERYAKAFGMRVLRFGRRGRGVLKGRQGLERVLREGDAILLSLPLTRKTAKIVSSKELSIMKDKAILVNVARGDLVDQVALYSHLESHPDFKYATDAWWFKGGLETLETDHPLIALSNFVGTPHMSGPTGVLSGLPGKLAVDNVMRYLRGERPLHLVNRSEYEAGP
jgi:phosphoglycerate dehydrogenase-like enzyme